MKDTYTGICPKTGTKAEIRIALISAKTYEGEEYAKGQILHCSLINGNPVPCKRNDCDIWANIKL